MLVTKDWSAPQKITYGRNISLQYFLPGFSVRIFNAAGASFEKQVVDGKKTEINASEIMHVAHPLINLQAVAVPETHVHIECPDC